MLHVNLHQVEFYAEEQNLSTKKKFKRLTERNLPAQSETKGIFYRLLAILFHRFYLHGSVNPVKV